MCPHVVSPSAEHFRSSETRAGCCQNGDKWKIGHCSKTVQGNIGHCSKTVQGNIGHCSKTVQGKIGHCSKTVQGNIGHCSKTVQGKIGHCSKTVQGITCTLVFVTHRQGSSCKRSPAGCQPECVRNAPIVEISLDTWGLANVSTAGSVDAVFVAAFPTTGDGARRKVPKLFCTGWLSTTLIFVVLVLGFLSPAFAGRSPWDEPFIQS